MRIGMAAAFVLAGLSWTSGWSAGDPIKVSIPPSVFRYARAVQADTTRDVESLYLMGMATGEELILPPGLAWDSTLELLSEADFTAVQDTMKGFFVNREEVVFVRPDPEFFEMLAHRRGDAMSVDFFETAKQTAAFDWPTYLEQQTDYSGCTKYGSLEVVRCYRLWSRFQKLYPGHYADRVRQVLSDIELEFTEAICACGEKAGVLDEFKAFLREFPNAAIAPQVRERLKAAEGGTLEMRYHCISG